MPVADIQMVEVTVFVRDQSKYPYCKAHASSVNPYGLGIILSSASEYNAKLFVLEDKFVYQFQVRKSFRTSKDITKYQIRQIILLQVPSGAHQRQIELVPQCNRECLGRPEYETNQILQRSGN